MKNTILLTLVFVVAAVTSATAQKKWDQLTQEEKVMKAKEFRADNQKFLKDSLGMTAKQMNDIDNVNLCYLSTLDRINRYGKDKAKKEKVADALTTARSFQLDAIMGSDKRSRYADYIMAKIDKAKAKGM